MSLNKYILITGGAGFIGSHVASKFFKKGYSILIVDNLFRGSLKNIESILNDKRNKFFQLDLLYNSSINELIKIYDKYNPEIIIHYAAINGTQYFYDEPAKVANVNSIGSYNLLQSLNYFKGKNQKPLICFASTSEVYGEPFNVPTSESDITHVRLDMDRDSYACAKLMSEFYFKLSCRELGIDYHIFRIFNVYGPKMIGTKYGQVVPEFISRIINGEYPLKMFGKGNHSRSFCYIDDHVDLTYKLVQSGIVNEVINLGNPYEISILDLAKEIFNCFEIEPKFDFLNEREGDHLRRSPDIKKLTDICGNFNFTSLNKGLNKTIKFYRDLKNERH